jgi:DNA-binding GntR family transcriptional regulator
MLDGSPLGASASLADDIARRLREAIVLGELEPGTRVQEELVAATLGTSRGPVREAFQQLEREGLIIRKRHRGAFIARLAVEDVSEIFSLRLVFERLAMETAARSTTEEDFVRLDEGLASFSDSLNSDLSLQGLTAVDLDFHDLIYRAAHHDRLYRLWSELRPQIHILLLSGWGRSPGEPGFGDFVIHVHQEMIDVLRSHDVALAGKIAEEHVRRNYEKVMAGYQQDVDGRGRRIADTGLNAELLRHVDAT